MKRSFVLSLVLAVFLAAGPSKAWGPLNSATSHQTARLLLPVGSSSTFLKAAVDTKENQAASAEETTEKYGLEVGLFESLKRKDGGESAKSLLKRYGIAYLATSIPLALLSFILCYILVDNGVDVAGLLSKIGIQGNDTSEKAGTFALAYAAHKAASPIRFPPTVVLTPIVAKLIGKDPVEEENAES